MDEIGTVTAVDDTMATVCFVRSEACARCGLCRGMSATEMHVRVRNDCQAVVGDRVRVVLRSESFLTAAFVLYGVPLVGLMIGFMAGYGIGTAIGMDAGRAILGFVCGVAMTGAVLPLIKWLEPRWTSDKYMPVAVRIEP